MQRYYLKIENVIYHSVNVLTVTNTARRRRERENFNGDLIIDQAGTSKKDINVNIALISHQNYLNLLTAKATPVLSVTYTDGTSTSTINATITSDIQHENPFYLNGDKTQGIYYNNVSFVLREM